MVPDITNDYKFDNILSYLRFVFKFFNQSNLPTHTGYVLQKKKVWRSSLADYQ